MSLFSISAVVTSLMPLVRRVMYVVSALRGEENAVTRIFALLCHLFPPALPVISHFPLVHNALQDETRST